MTTRGSCIMCAAMTSLLILSSIVSNAEGKCSGKWAIHACWGGNGKKRSGIPAEEDTAKSLDLLRRLLRRKAPSSYLPSLEDTVFVPVQPEDFLSSSESLPSSSSSSSSASSSLLSSSSPFEDSFSEDVGETGASFVVPYKNRLASLTTILRKLQQGRDDFQ